MANRLDGRSVPVTLDRERRLRYTFNALCALQERLGLKADELLAETRLGFAQMRSFLWAGLIEEEPEITPEAVGELVQDYIESGRALPALMAQMLEALRLSGLTGQGKPAAGDAAPPFVSPPSSMPPSAAPENAAG